MLKSLIEENKNLKKLIELYRYDNLTNLLGGIDFKLALNNLTKESKTLVMVDINGLHNVNRDQSYEAGDRLIISVADELKRVFKDDEIYRTQGDEFYIITSKKNINNLNILNSEVGVSSINRRNVKESLNDVDRQIINKKKANIVFTSKKRR